MLTPRLRKIAEQAETGVICADIGTDHAYLPVFLVQNGIVPSAIASDLREGPLSRAKETIREAALQERVLTVLAPGLEGILPGSCGQCIIAGMGGLTIQKILEDSGETARSMRRLILQPQNAQEKLRAWLMNNGFSIEREIIAAEDRRFYTILVVKPDNAPYKLSEDECYFGKKDVRVMDKDYKAYLQAMVRKYESLCTALENSSNEAAQTKKQEALRRLKALKEDLSEIVE